MEDVPPLPGVEQHILPLGRDGIDVSIDFLPVGPVMVYRSNFRTRLWLQEVGFGDPVVVALMLPRGDPVRLWSRRADQPTIMCWHGVGRPEYDYVPEPGTLFYVFEMSSAVWRAHGWLLPPSAPFPVPPSTALDFAKWMDARIAFAENGGSLHAQSRAAEILDTVDHLTGDALYRHAGTGEAPGAMVSQRRVVRSAVEFLRDYAHPGAVTSQQIGAELGISSRTVFAAFQNHLGLGPRQMHTLMRLYRLRHMLAVNSPERATVADLTHEAGFTHLGRTSGIYREHFGESPSGTLRRGT